MSDAVLVTGGAGYIGSHATLCLLEAGYSVVVLDNLCNSSAKSLERVTQICGREPHFVQGDIRDTSLVEQTLKDHDVSVVLHFAGLKAVGESVEQPLRYYENNVAGSVSLCKAMQAAGVFNLVFSSSATVYGDPERMPIDEDCPAGTPTNPYGLSKKMVEQVLSDVAASDARWSMALLRYFNPVGAHESGLIGEDPQGILNNLVPYVSQVAVGKLAASQVFGDDYPTEDGTGVRDYIHVVDLAKGHLKAIEALKTRKGAHVWNLGTGKGYSVLQVVKAFEQASGKSIPFNIAPRRPGDIAECWANPEKARAELNWKAEYGIERMMADTWRWQENNPRGYED